jgi:hypothetical protein
MYISRKCFEQCNELHVMELCDLCIRMTYRSWNIEIMNISVGFACMFLKVHKIGNLNG